MDQLISAPLESFKPKFEIEHFDYVSRDRTRADFIKIISEFADLDKPIILLLTQREGRHINFGRLHTTYLRMELEDNNLEWVKSSADQYVCSSHVWGDDVLVIHVSMLETFFLFGPDENRIGPNFLKLLDGALKHPSIPWSAVVLAGAYNDLKWCCNPDNPRGPRVGGKVKSSDLVSGLRDLADTRLNELLAGFREHSPGVEILVTGTGCKSLFLPEDEVAREQSLRSKPGKVHHVITLDTHLNELTGDWYDALVLYHMTWLNEMRARTRSAGGKKIKWTPAPFELSVHQWYTNEGFIISCFREAFTMDLCNTVLRGYGFRHLGDPTFPSVDLRLCAGQFHYQINEYVQEGPPRMVYRCVMCIPPTEKHEHGGVPCLLKGPPFCGEVDRVSIQVAELEGAFVSPPIFGPFFLLLCEKKNF